MEKRATAAVTQSAERCSCYVLYLQINSFWFVFSHLFKHADHCFSVNAVFFKNYAGGWRRDGRCFPGDSG